MKPNISIIIPVFNTELWLYRCLESVCSQTLKNIEIICVNDGSIDKSSDIINKYALRDNRVVSISLGRNRGVSTARNIGITAAQSEWIGFLDSDDTLDSEFCEKLYTVAKSSDADVVKGVLWSERNAPRYISSDINEQIRKSKLNFTCEWISAIYRKNFLRSNNITFLDGCTNGEDAAFLYNVVICADMIDVVNDAIYYYYFRKDSAYQQVLTYDKMKSVIDSIFAIVSYIDMYIHDRDKYINEYIKIIWICTTYPSRVKEDERLKICNYIADAISKIIKNCRESKLLCNTIREKHVELIPLIYENNKIGIINYLGLTREQRIRKTTLQYLRKKILRTRSNEL